MADQVAAIRHPIDDNDLVMIILAGLGPTYEVFISNVTTCLDEYTLEDVLAHLTTHETLMGQQRSATTEDGGFPSVNVATNSSNNVVTYSSNHSKDGRSGGSGGSRGHGKGKNNQPRCQIYLQFGH